MTYNIESLFWFEYKLEPSRIEYVLDHIQFINDSNEMSFFFIFNDEASELGLGRCEVARDLPTLHNSVIFIFTAHVRFHVRHLGALSSHFIQILIHIYVSLNFIWKKIKFFIFFYMTQMSMYQEKTRRNWRPDFTSISYWNINLKKVYISNFSVYHFISTLKVDRPKTKNIQ